MEELQHIESKLSRRPHSPLFARLAGEYLISGKIEEALKLCDSGLRNYPLYPTAHLIHSKCLAAKEDYLSALVHLQSALDIALDSTILRNLEREWKEKAVQQRVSNAPALVTVVEELPLTEHVSDQSESNGLTSTEILEWVDRQLTDEKEPQVIIPEESSEGLSEMVQPVVQPAIGGLEILPANPEQPGTEIIEKVSLAHADEPVLVPREHVAVELEKQVRYNRVPVEAIIEGERIVTKTLAEIYATQGAYGEAITTYQLLKHQRPNQVEEFEQRIKELETKLPGKQS